MARAARLGLPAAGDAPDGGELTFRWRMAEHAVSFETDEFDQAKMAPLITSLVTGTGEYRVRLSLPDPLRRVLRRGERRGAVRGLRAGTRRVARRVHGDRHRPARLLPARLPAAAHPQRQRGPGHEPGPDGAAPPLRRDGRVPQPGRAVEDRVHHAGRLLQGRGGAGRHKLDPLAADLGVETDFAFDPKTEETTLVVANGKAGGST